jgi:hypothetical protein
MEDKKLQCSNCKCWREFENFIGKNNNLVKRCVKCREKDAKQKQRPEVKEKRNLRQKEKKYYVAHREKKRQENEEEYLAHNADIMKQWRNKNTEHLTLWRQSNINYKLKGIRGQATSKGYPWNITTEKAREIMESNCYYCDSNNPLCVNGIDRIDSNKGYEQTNVLSSCKVCNFMKICLDINTFIDRCKHITEYSITKRILHPDIWVDTKCSSYISYKRRAEKKSLEFLLTTKDFEELNNKICEYCGKENSSTHKNGIDRKNNKIGYTTENCVACCGECNFMKGELDDIDFIQ